MSLFVRVARSNPAARLLVMRQSGAASRRTLSSAEGGGCGAGGGAGGCAGCGGAGGAGGGTGRGDGHHEHHPVFKPGPFSHKNIGIIFTVVFVVPIVATVFITDFQLRKTGFKK